MAKNFRSIILKQASSLDKAVNYLRNILDDSLWLQSLRDAAADIRAKCNGVDWTVEITDMDLPMDRNPMHLKPQILANKLKMFVSIKMTCNAELWNAGEDCITELCFKVSIQEKENRDFEKIYHTGFHIDKTNDAEKLVHEEIHPLYHVHFVNESKMGEFEALSMDIPRLSHHPVDLFLGLMLVFANYNKSVYDKLKDNAFILNLCKESAQHYVEPYIRSLAKKPWSDGEKQKIDKELCPYLVL